MIRIRCLRFSLALASSVRLLKLAYDAADAATIFNDESAFLNTVEDLEFESFESPFDFAPTRSIAFPLLRVEVPDLSTGQKF